MTSQFDDVPSFVPPHPPRPAKPVPTVRAIAMFAQDVLSPFAEVAYRRPFTRRRVLGRDLLIFNSPATVREALVGRHEALQRKTAQMRGALEPLLGDGLFISDGRVWKERRALLAPIVHARHMKSFFPVMLEAAVEWREHWRVEARKGPIDVLNEMGLLTAEIISRTVFGQRVGRHHTDQVVRSFAEYQRHVGQTGLADLLNLPPWFPRFQGGAVKRSARRIHAVVDQIIDEHLRERAAEGGDGGAAAAHGCPHQRAMIAQLFDAGENGTADIDREGIRNEAIVLFMAGHETTANTLAWAFYLLSEADWAREKLEEEAGRVLGDRDPTFEDVDKLVYTRAVVEETLRLYPPVPILGREAVCPTEVGGEKVAEGAIAVVMPWLLHRNPDLWERPDDFIPERFLPSVERPGKYQYVPFAVGPRVCPGLTFGLTEATICLAVLAKAFDLRLAPGARVKPTTRLTLRPGDTLPMVVTEKAARPLVQAAE